MPTYVYRREDGSTFEIKQRITADALDTCPTTGQPVTRIISGNTGLIFKGSGFYLTDYARKNSSPPGNDQGSANGDEKKEAKSESNSEKPASSDKTDTSTSAGASKSGASKSGASKSGASKSDG